MGQQELRNDTQDIPRAEAEPKQPTCPRRSKSEPTDQTQQVLKAIDALLDRAGTSKTCLLMVQIFLPNLDDFEGMNHVWEDMDTCRTCTGSRDCSSEADAPRLEN